MTTMRHRMRKAVAIVFTGALVTAGVATATIATTTPAQAATCQTRGHAYLTVPGRAFFSGFENDQSLGIPTFYTQTFFGTHKLGGNGIAPGANISFQFINKDTGQLADFFTTQRAGSNCVVNETQRRVVVAPGNYRLTATYLAGNSRQYVVNEPVTDIVVSP